MEGVGPGPAVEGNRVCDRRVLGQEDEIGRVIADGTGLRINIDQPGKTGSVRRCRAGRADELGGTGDERDRDVAECRLVSGSKILT